MAPGKKKLDTWYREIYNIYFFLEKEISNAGVFLFIMKLYPWVSIFAV